MDEGRAPAGCEREQERGDIPEQQVLDHVRAEELVLAELGEWREGRTEEDRDSGDREADPQRAPTHR
jgi:hypothetical protein